MPEERKVITAHEWLFPPLIYAAIICLLPLMLVLCVPYGVMMVLCQRYREHRFSKKMHERGRFITWEQLESRFQSGEGTLIVEQAQKDRHRVWWTQEDVEREAPMQSPPEQELDYLRLKPPHPFVYWCFQRYLDPDSGKASLTTAPYSFPSGFVEKAFFGEKFPTLRVVMSVKLA